MNRNLFSFKFKIIILRQNIYKTKGKKNNFKRILSPSGSLGFEERKIFNEYKN